MIYIFLSISETYAIYMRYNIFHPDVIFEKLFHRVLSTMKRGLLDRQIKERCRDMLIRSRDRACVLKSSVKYYKKVTIKAFVSTFKFL